MSWKDFNDKVDGWKGIIFLISTVVGITAAVVTRMNDLERIDREIAKIRADVDASDQAVQSIEKSLIEIRTDLRYFRQSFDDLKEALKP
ncbi:MAG: hypothetical protein AAF226_08680 [Verrucomicrobiota bacterium]